MSKRHSPAEQHRLALKASHVGSAAVAAEAGVEEATVKKWMYGNNIIPSAHVPGTEVPLAAFEDLFGSPVHVIDATAYVDTQYFDPAWMEDPDEAATHVGDINVLPPDAEGFEKNTAVFTTTDVCLTLNTAMAAARHSELMTWFQEIYQRHQNGDWGDLDAEDKRANQWALSDGSRLMSAYEIPEDFACKGVLRDSSMWVITDGGSSKDTMGRTTILFPSDY